MCGVIPGRAWSSCGTSRPPLTRPASSRRGGSSEGSSIPLVFYFDLGSPYAYLAAERIGRLFPEPPLWQPILLGGLFKRLGTGSWALGDARATNVAEIERRARPYGLPPVVWSKPFPGNTLFAMRPPSHPLEAGSAGRPPHAQRPYRHQSG